MKDSNDPKSARGWDTYWAGALGADAFTSGGVSHPSIASFWDTTFSELLAAHAHVRILDIATGGGAVIERISEQPMASLDRVTCVDISSAAIIGVQSRFPSVVGVVADARSMPLASGEYDLVTSQFGIEYAGLPTINEAARLLAPGGAMVLLMHIRPGVIFQECATALDAIRRTQNCAFVQRALLFFEAGFAAVGGADRAPYDEAALQLNPAIRELESILSEYGEHVAADTIAQLYTDVQRIHSRLPNYEPEAVLQWLRRMDKELSEYEERMASMCQAAIDDEDFQGACKNLRGQGFTIVRGEPLIAASDELPSAWILHAIRSN